MRSSVRPARANSDLFESMSVSSSTDEELVSAAKNGDELAFEILINRYKSRIFNLALGYTRVREDAEDIVQQTLQKTFVHLRDFQGKSSFSTWLTRIAVNESLMFLRRGRYLRETPINEIHAEEVTRDLEIGDPSPNPEDSFLQAERARMLSSAIAQLRPAMRVTIELRELRELSGAETARHMGVSLSAVKARVFHGRKKLGEILRRSARVSGKSGQTRAAIRNSFGAGRKVA